MPRLESEQVQALLAESPEEIWTEFSRLKTTEEQIRFLEYHQLGTIFYREKYPNNPEYDEPIACLLRTPLRLQDGHEREDYFVLIEYQGNNDPGSEILKLKGVNIRLFYETYFPYYYTSRKRIAGRASVRDYINPIHPEYSKLDEEGVPTLKDALMTEISYRNNNLRGYKRPNNLV